jgi:predicted transglutaminase-like cysteine proteinase
MSASILSYIATMDAATVDNPTGDGFCVTPLCTGTGTGTSGCVALADIPAMTCDGVADWAPIGIATLPTMAAMGTTDDYRPAWGDLSLPALSGDGTAHVIIESQCLLTPLFGVGYTGAVASNAMPAFSAYGIDDSFNRAASGAGTIPSLTASTLVCGIDKPIDNGATSAAVVNLLQQGNTTIADAAEAVCTGMTTSDAKALVLVRYVSNLLTYTSDSSSGIGDRWTCALATLQREYGDCEDGAILLHSLLLAAGVNPGRIRTAFGTAMSSALTEVGHAWVMYRRLTDEEWIPLEWTAQPTPYTVPIYSINRQVDRAADYTAISYILTDEKFYTVADINYIANLAANRSTGEAAIPALEADGASGPRCAASLRLGKMDATGQAGASLSDYLPKLVAMGSGQQLGTAQGAAIMPALAATGYTGAHGAASLSKLAAVAQCGTSASGKANIPALTLSASAQVDLLCAGSLSLPKLTMTGRGNGGSLLAAAATLPPLAVTGRAKQGPVAKGAGKLPRLSCLGHAAVLVVAEGDAELPPLEGRGHAVNVSTSWGKPLRYNPNRWA